MGDSEIVFDLLPESDATDVDILELYDTFLEDMSEFEFEASKKLTDMVNSIELRKNEALFKEFTESISLKYNISDSLAVEETKAPKKKSAKKSDDLLEGDDQLLDKSIPDFLQSPEIKLSKQTPVKKSEYKGPNRLSHGNTMDESQLKLNLKQPAMQQQANNQHQSNYFNNYQTVRAHNPYLMPGEKMDQMQGNIVGSMNGMMTGRLAVSPSHHVNTNQSYFPQSMVYGEQASYMNQHGGPPSMGKTPLTSDVSHACSYASDAWPTPRSNVYESSIY